MFNTNLNCAEEYKAPKCEVVVSTMEGILCESTPGNVDGFDGGITPFPW